MGDNSNKERKEDIPPLSRLFVVCNKSLTEDDLRRAFSPFGDIDNLYMPRDAMTGGSKGVAFIKYSKTSEAARAIAEMNLKPIGQDKPIRVMLATNKGDKSAKNEEYGKRLFIICSPKETESELSEYFANFGKLDKVFMQRHKTTEASKGLAYICYKDFVSAANAYEQCDRKYRAVFAKPRDDLKRTRDTFEPFPNPMHDVKRSSNSNNRPNLHPKDDFSSMLSHESGPDGCTTVKVMCSSQLSQHHIAKLFNIVPGMLSCNYEVDVHSGCGKGTVTYKTPAAATHAVDRLHNLEYPFGEKLLVRLDDSIVAKVANNLMQTFKDAMNSGKNLSDFVQLAEAMSQASSLIKSATSSSSISVRNHLNCSTELPSPQPLAKMDSPVAKRCFIVCKPNPPPLPVLKDIFCRFGDLISVYMLPSKTYGFVKYASVQAANDAIATLNGATVAGILLKVLVAEGHCDSNDKQGKRLKTESDL